MHCSRVGLALWEEASAEVYHLNKLAFHLRGQCRDFNNPSQLAFQDHPAQDFFRRSQLVFLLVETSVNRCGRPHPHLFHPFPVNFNNRSNHLCNSLVS